MLLTLTLLLATADLGRGESRRKACARTCRPRISRVCHVTGVKPRRCKADTLRDCRQLGIELICGTAAGRRASIGSLEDFASQLRIDTAAGTLNFTFDPPADRSAYFCPTSITVIQNTQQFSVGYAADFCDDFFVPLNFYVGGPSWFHIGGNFQVCWHGLCVDV